MRDDFGGLGQGDGLAVGSDATDEGPVEAGACAATDDGGRLSVRTGAQADMANARIRGHPARNPADPHRAVFRDPDRLSIADLLQRLTRHTNPEDVSGLFVPRHGPG
jgi:hypothetical protein